MREREPTSTTEKLETELGGATHRGQRVVLRVSDQEIYQEIRFESLRQVDRDVYRQHEGDFMLAIAREILGRLVRQWEAEVVRRPMKPEPERRSRRGPGKAGS